ncbi:MAG: metalloregulator ArsR/SmtB family transcription factor [Planctomycetota bacterium]|jgi:ArsR family transcriptional regulator|nr:metalloregulator ArsR/SmtB family transcription factor [Planctomycetota bacterium]
MEHANLLPYDHLVRAAPMIRICAHPVRLRIIDFLRSGEQCVGDISSASDSPQAVTSQHLSTLRQNGILSANRKGQKVFYTLVRTEVLGLLDCIQNHCRM